MSNTCNYDHCKAKHEQKSYFGRFGNRIKHKNCIKTIDTLVNRKYVYIVTEKMNGEELFERIIDRTDYTFTEEETAIVMHQLLEAVEYLHVNNTVPLALGRSNSTG